MKISGKPEHMTLGEWEKALQVIDGEQLGIHKFFLDGLEWNLVQECGSEARALQVLVYVDRWYRTPWMEVVNSSKSVAVHAGVSNNAPSSPGRTIRGGSSTRGSLVPRLLLVGVAAAFPVWQAIQILSGPK